MYALWVGKKKYLLDRQNRVEIFKKKNQYLLSLLRLTVFSGKHTMIATVSLHAIISRFTRKPLYSQFREVQCIYIHHNMIPCQVFESHESQY